MILDELAKTRYKQNRKIIKLSNIKNLIKDFKNNKKKILETNDMLLCQWAGITEQEYNSGELEEIG